MINVGVDLAKNISIVITQINMVQSEIRIFPERIVRSLNIAPLAGNLTVLVEVDSQDSALAISACSKCQVTRMVKEPTHCSSVVGRDATLAMLVIGTRGGFSLKGAACAPVQDIKSLVHKRLNITDEARDFAKGLMDNIGNGSPDA